MPLPDPVYLEHLASQEDGRDAAIGYVSPGDKLYPRDKILYQEGLTYEDYEGIARDPQVFSTFQQRRMALIGTPWEVVPGDVDDPRSVAAADLLRENLESIDMDRIHNKMLYGILNGKAIGECLYSQRADGTVWLDDILVKKHWRFCFDVEHNLYLQVASGQEVMMPDMKFWVISAGGDSDDDPYGLGLAHYLYWPVTIKKAITKFWSTSLERFGTPAAFARVSDPDYGNDAVINNTLANLASLQSQSIGVFKESSDIQFLEASSDNDGFSSLFSLCAQEVSKIVLSQTMTTDQGSSRSQSETHMNVRREVTMSDADLSCGAFNESVATWLTEWNFGPDVAPPKYLRRTSPEDAKRQEMEARASIDKMLYDMGYQPTPEYVELTYGPGYELRPPAPAGVQFAESPSGRGHTIDQNEIDDVAYSLSQRYQEVLGGRIDELLGVARETGDLVAFRERLLAMLRAGPSDEMMTAIMNPTMYSRLMGLYRGQSREDDGEQ